MGLKSNAPRRLRGKRDKPNPSNICAEHFLKAEDFRKAIKEASVNPLAIAFDIKKELTDGIKDGIADGIKNLDMAIMEFVRANPGARVPTIVNNLRKTYPNLSESMVKNHIRRNLRDYIIFRGTKKAGGYFLR